MSGSEKKKANRNTSNKILGEQKRSFVLQSLKTTAKKCTKKCAAGAKLCFC